MMFGIKDWFWNIQHDKVPKSKNLSKIMQLRINMADWHGCLIDYIPLGRIT